MILFLIPLNIVYFTIFINFLTLKDRIIEYIKTEPDLQESFFNSISSKKEDDDFAKNELTMDSVELILDNDGSDNITLNLYDFYCNTFAFLCLDRK